MSFMNPEKINAKLEKSYSMSEVKSKKKSRQIVFKTNVLHYTGEHFKSARHCKKWQKHTTQNFSKRKHITN